MAGVGPQRHREKKEDRATSDLDLYPLGRCPCTGTVNCSTCWIPKATNTLRMCNTYSSSWQPWLRERGSLLSYTYTASVVSLINLTRWLNV